MTAFQKTIKYAAMAFAVFLAVCIVAGVVGALSSVTFLLSDKEENVGDMKTYEVSNEIKSLKIDVETLRVEIKSGERFSLSSNATKLNVKESGGILSVTEEGRLFLSYSSKGVLVLTVPAEHQFERVELKTGAGRVDIDALSGKRLELEFGAGNVNIARLDAELSAEIEGGVGELTIKSGEIRGLELDMGVGELNLGARLLGNSNINCGVGESNIRLIGSLDNYSIRANTGLGKITLDGEKLKNRSVTGSGENKVDIDGGVGTVKIEFAGLVE